VSTSRQVMKFAAHSVKMSGDKKTFDWKGFQNAIGSYDDVDLVFDRVKELTINQSTATVSVMAGKLASLLKDAFAMAMKPSDVASLTKGIESTFTGLETAHEQGFASFSKGTSGHNSSWEYRIVFAFPNPKVEEDFYSLVTTIYLTADIVDESSWWGMQSSTSHNFAAKATCMRLVVTKGFKDPVSAGEVLDTSSWLVLLMLVPPGPV
jgi:hypothetical protein